MKYELNSMNGSKFTDELLSILLDEYDSVPATPDTFIPLSKSADALRLEGIPEECIFIYLSQSVFTYASDNSIQDATAYASKLLTAVSKLESLKSNIEIINLLIASKNAINTDIASLGDCFVKLVTAISTLDDGLLKTAFMQSLRTITMNPFLMQSPAGRSSVRIMTDYLKTRDETEWALTLGTLSLGVFIK